MKEVFSIISVALYFIVGVICLVMAYKSIFSKKYLPFHEKAAHKAWDNIDKPLQYVILTILRVSGLGFLVVGLLLIIFPSVNYFRPDTFVKYSIPVIALIYCIGLFLFNYYLYKKTEADTPWIGSIVAMVIILIGIIASSI
jgi:hypothetical protein